MLVIVLVMLVILVLAGLVVLYVAFPHRGEEVPRPPWLGEAMAQGRRRRAHARQHRRARAADRATRRPLRRASLDPAR